MKVDTVAQCCSRICLDQPDGRNTLDGDGGALLLKALDEAEKHRACRFVMLVATGSFFCSGLELGEALKPGRSEEVLPLLREVLMRLACSPLITIAVVNGAALGGGVGLAGACDCVVAGPCASFQLTEVRLGLVPAMILPILARRIGSHRALQLALTAQRVDAETAATIGLADQHVADADSAARKLLNRLRSSDNAALRSLKTYYTSLYPADWVSADSALTVLRQCLAGSASTRIEALRKAGALC